MPDYTQYRLLPLERRSPLDSRDFHHVPRLSLAPGTPVEVDLHNFGGRDLMPPIRDQGTEGSCTAQAATALLNHLYIAAGVGAPVFSPAFTYYLARAIEGWQNQDAGAYERDNFTTMVQTGACPEALMPYVAGQFAIAPTPAQVQAAAPYKLGSYAGVATANDALATLAGGLALSAGSNWYQNWYYPTNGVLDTPVGASLGGHQWLWCGARVQNGVQQVRDHNSWGTAWGDGTGHAWLPVSFFGPYIFELWTGALPQVVPPPPSPPTPPKPLTHDVASAAAVNGIAEISLRVHRATSPNDPRLANVIQRFSDFALILRGAGVDVERELSALLRVN